MDRKGARPIAWFRFTGKSLGWLWSLPSHLYCTKASRPGVARRSWSESVGRGNATSRLQPQWVGSDDRLQGLRQGHRCAVPVWSRILISSPCW